MFVLFSSLGKYAFTLLLFYFIFIYKDLNLALFSVYRITWKKNIFLHKKSVAYKVFLIKYAISVLVSSVTGIEYLLFCATFAKEERRMKQRK